MSENEIEIAMKTKKSSVVICALLALVLSSCAGKTGNQYLETSQSGFDKPISHYQINIEECLKNEGSGPIRLSELYREIEFSNVELQIQIVGRV
ncbi:hypothetical protein MASR1M31_23610 [Porphyromonadaceae bacterium]